MNNDSGIVTEIKNYHKNDVVLNEIKEEKQKMYSEIVNILKDEEKEKRLIRIVFGRTVSDELTAFVDTESFIAEVPIEKPHDSFGDYHIIGAEWIEAEEGEQE